MSSGWAGAPKSRPVAIGMAAIAVVGALLYARTATHGFVYDDHWTVIGNAKLDEPLSALLRAAFTGSAVQERIPDATRPAMIASLWVDRRLFGGSPVGYHLHSVFLYAVASALAGLAALAITRSRRIALVAGLLFATAPVHAEPVSAINYREDLLAGIAVLATLAAVFLPRRRDKMIDRGAVAALALLVGLLAKESAIAVVALVAGIALVQRRGLAWFRARRAVIGPLGLTVVAWSIWRGWLRLSGRDDVPLALRGPTGVGRILDTARYETRAVVHSLWPYDWSPDHGIEPRAGLVWVAALALVVGAIVVASNRRRTRNVGVGLCIAITAPLATSPLVGPINPSADRYWFVAVLGGAIVWGWVASKVATHVPSTVRFAAVVVLLVPGIVISQSASSAWASDAALWEAGVVRTPTSPRAWTGLAQVRRRSGDLDGADAAIERAVQLDPRSTPARMTRAYNLLARGDVERARAEIEEIHRLGGGRLRGMNRARRCAQLPPEAARACIRP